MEDEFYIGWQDNEPKGYKRAKQKFFWLALIALVLVAGLFTLNQKPFPDSYFVFGEMTELTGTIVTEPVLGLRVKDNGQVLTIPLVGLGKFAAQPVVDYIIKETGDDINGYQVTLIGTQFHYQGKYWMELTKGNASVLKIEENTSDENRARALADLGPITIEGEIVDPKCFFGQMKPAYKAIHRSCAVRCISGGIPPVLAIRENGKFVDYYFLTNAEDEPLNEEVLAWVGVPITLSGKAKSFDDWKSIQLEANSFKLTQNVTSPIVGYSYACRPID